MTLKFANVLVILGKIGGPVLKVLAKALKFTKVIKFGLAGGSVAAYAFMFTWQFALIIVAFLFVHEYGHIWAMKHYGLKTKGIYFIPFLGAAAVTDQEFPSYKSEVFIALAGPLVGMVPAVAFGIIFLMTKINFFGGAALWMFMVTAFNLLPIMPLDGGRVFRCVALSLTSWGGLALYAGGIALLIVLSKYIGLGLLIFCMAIGGLEVILEFFSVYGKRRRHEKALENTVKQVLGPNFKDKEKQAYILSQPDPAEYIREAIRSGMKDVGKKPMSQKLIVGSFAAWCTVIAVSVGMVFFFHSIPGASMALKLLSK